MKRYFALLVILALLLSLLPACGSGGSTGETGNTVTFMDSAGRQVTVPAEITRIAPSGAVATMLERLKLTVRFAALSRDTRLPLLRRVTSRKITNGARKTSAG